MKQILLCLIIAFSSFFAWHSHAANDSERRQAIIQNLEQATAEQANDAVFVMHLKTLRTYVRDYPDDSDSLGGITLVLDYYLDFPPTRVSALLRVIARELPTPPVIWQRIPQEVVSHSPPTNQGPGPALPRGIEGRRIKKMGAVTYGSSTVRKRNGCKRVIGKKSNLRDGRDRRRPKRHDDGE